MKTLTPEQRIEGFTELEGVLGEGGVGGAHLMSFLAGIAHAEKVLAELAQDEEPVAWASGVRDLLSWDKLYDDMSPLYSHSKQKTQNEKRMDAILALCGKSAPRPEFVRLSEEEVNEFVGGVDCDRNYELICAVENRLVEKNRG